MAMISNLSKDQQGVLVVVVCFWFCVSVLSNEVKLDNSELYQNTSTSSSSSAILFSQRAQKRSVATSSSVANQIFSTENCTVILAQLGGTATLPCLVKKIASGVEEPSEIEQFNHKPPGVFMLLESFHYLSICIS
ncbi:hypothetical protein M8J76_014966 [Diaphorina citri]|nr:hypothetical protein M8J76_014966 [Diaphorina citri]